ncbi:hypothetical protein [cyanobacterium endosymbiont of Epithemia clementina EcSB]|uniref:hypothetical protein n=1 Tax=cyanobacterium endosymbiont of Epithemia clementina EcSB TaxID=3034674 RepID=UPI0024803613|nr:hypothetical protein [cyanobacterium endosymbiont of Epithemia clementina EcSB]WGT68181.1 hypothetical protein P3F56_03700 [cyanobacterium endosymbiont of Epithemia clementina EcSB]
MISIDLTLKYTSIPISVQRKEAENADSLYEKIISAMRSTTPELIELTCEKQTEKKVAVMSDQISAVILSHKDGAASTGRVPGFFS